MLYVRDYRPADPSAVLRAPIVCLAGLSRNARDFDQFASMISSDSERPRRVLALDYRGRGRSGWDENKANYNLAVECDDVLTAMAAFGIERAIFVGTSRGGLILHLLAASKPDMLEAMILNDIGPVVEVAGLQEITAYLGRGSEPKDWNDAANILHSTHGPTFPALTAMDWHDMARAIYAEKDGRIVADFDPAIAEQLRALDLAKPLPELWPQFEAFKAIPVMAVRGEHSRLLSDKTLTKMARRHPGLRSCIAKGQGHAPLLHKSDIFTAITEFLRTI
ncbi:alpha/beta hydrolase [Rhizobium sp. ARZ01]|uniref:alpha/beta fold hydrolase n=1 Tax=Rhizobium sp. ARZ01 TaxID=2769313 RepID=UPI0017869FB9|nr:alpha/beta hydrolase [Rhizobium sp. ARZ01]MBD9371619.1 alpha/beta hydrolase [Rhizobium sp. ARZ01]